MTFDLLYIFLSFTSVLHHSDIGCLKFLNHHLSVKIKLKQFNLEEKLILKIIEFHFVIFIVFILKENLPSLAFARRTMNKMTMIY
jgi:hypothetical protein